MTDIVKFEGADGTFMWVELSRPSQGAAASDQEHAEIGLVVDVRDGVRKATTALEDSLDSIRGAGVALMNAVAGLTSGDGRMTLDEVSLELGLSFGAEGGIVVAKGSAGVAASVTLTWRDPASR
jgi:hypothetical protein